MDTPQPVKKRDGRKITGIALLVAPTALVTLAVLTELIVSTIMVVGTDEVVPLEQQPLIAQFIAICAFFTGGLGVLSWLPCLIVGIILLATKKK